MTNIIIFGATGDVGSATARIVRQHNHNVFLAVRDLQKPMPGLSLQEEQEAGFRRVKVDLNDPQSVHLAVTESKATRAFLYLTFGAEDHMKASINALKSAGIEYVVFLSSSSIHGEAKDLPQEAGAVPWQHAQVEINLEQTFGPQGFAAVRPGYFATNSTWWAGMVRSGELFLSHPDILFDWVAPIDIGALCAALLVSSSGATSSNVVFIFGPQLISHQEGLCSIAKAIGIVPQWHKVDPAEEVKKLASHGAPEALASIAVGVSSHRAALGQDDDSYADSLYPVAVSNVEKLIGRPLTTLSEWIEQNKLSF